MHHRKRSAGVRRKMHSHGCKVIFVSLLRPNEKMTMDLKGIYTFLLAHLSRRLRGELIVYRSSRRPSMRLCVRLCVHIFKH